MVEPLEQPRYILECGVQHSAMSNPHQYILRILERSLNVLTSDAENIWFTMFQVSINVLTPDSGIYFTNTVSAT